MAKTTDATGGSIPKDSGGAGQAKPGIVARARTFFSEVRSEMGKVVWPSKVDLKAHTQVVLVALGILALIIGVYDIFFLNFIKVFLRFG